MKTVFDSQNTGMLLIDHQVGTMGWIQSLPLDDVKRNTIVLAKTARALNLPVVLTSSMEGNQQGPLMPELQEILPQAFSARIKRQGVVNCWDDQAFAQAARNLKRKNLIIAGATTDVCVVYPAISAQQEGFNVQVVVDACGSPTKIADEIAFGRMAKVGVGLITTNAMVAELAKNWTSSDGQKLIQILFEDVISKL